MLPKSSHKPGCSTAVSFLDSPTSLEELSPGDPLAGQFEWPWKAALKWLIVQIKLILLRRLFAAIQHLHREVPVDLNLAMLRQRD